MVVLRLFLPPSAGTAHDRSAQLGMTSTCWVNLGCFYGDQSRKATYPLVIPVNLPLVACYLWQKPTACATQTHFSGLGSNVACPSGPATEPATHKAAKFHIRQQLSVVWNFSAASAALASFSFQRITQCFRVTEQGLLVHAFFMLLPGDQRTA